MTYYDPTEHMDYAERTDYEVRQHLLAQRRLREIEQGRTRRTHLFDEALHTRCCRKGCNRTDVRLIRLTGDVVCPEHDPLRECGASEDGWQCSVPHPAHSWPHRFTRLG